MRETWVPLLGGKIPWRRERLLQYSGPENSTDCIVHAVAKSQTQRSDFHKGREKLRDWNCHMHTTIYKIGD